MNENLQIGNLGETRLIELIAKLVLKKTGKVLLWDDSFFANLSEKNLNKNIVLNSDMLVSTTDVPPSMNSYQIGRKSVIMNISDLVVKGVKPRGIIISMGLPKEFKKKEFIELVNGIIDCSKTFDLDYLGGDLNETQEIIINPTVFGLKEPSAIIYRRGAKVGDILVANSKFGLTGVGFDILLNRKGNLKDFPKYKRSILSVLEPEIHEIEAFELSKNKLATSSIDSSDGLAKSLKDLILSNPNLGFDINFNENLIDSEANNYSKEYNIPLEKLVFEGGEEFIHLFTIKPENLEVAQKITQKEGGRIFTVGKTISEEKVFILKDNKRIELRTNGFEHFN